MKAMIFFLLAGILCNCASKKEIDKKDRKYLHSLGIVYGPIAKVKETRSFTLKKDKDEYTYIFSEKERKLTIANEEKPYTVLYYDAHYRIDSSVDDFGDGQYTVIYYKFPFFEDYVHYSIKNGEKINFITQQMDSAARSVKFIIDGRLSNTEYFNEEGFKIKNESGYADAYTLFTYNEYGYPLEESVKVSSLPLTVTSKYKYEYDRRGNWTKRILERYDTRGLQYKMTTIREIEYRE